MQGNQAAQLDALDALPAVLEATGLSKPTIYKLARKGEFPRPIKVGSASRWLRREVQAYIARRVAERDAEAAA